MNTLPFNQFGEMIKFSFMNKVVVGSNPVAAMAIILNFIHNLVTGNNLLRKKAKFQTQTLQC